MAKKIKTVAGTDGYEYPVTSYELVVDENGESVKTKLAQLSGGSGGSAEAGGTGLTAEQAQQLNTAYTHSQTAHVQASDIPTKTSQLTNDSSFATETFVQNKIAEASLSGGEVDLSGYVTKGIGNASQITFSDGETFQTKLEAGTLKGEKGEKGDQGEQGIQGEQGAAGANGKDGLTTAISVNGTTYTHSDGTITLPNYPTVPTKTSQLTNDSGYLTEHQSLEGLATETYVDSSVANIVSSAPETLDTLNELATALGNDPNFATTVATELGTKVDKVDGKGLSTNDLSNLLKDQYDAAYQHSQTAHFSGSYNDLSDKPTIPSKTSELTNDRGYITSSDIPSSLPANGGNADTVGGYAIWVGTQAQYNAITSKSSTTIYLIKEG